MAFLLEGAEALGGIETALNSASDYLAGGRLLSANTPVSVDPIISQEFRTPISGDSLLSNTVKDIRPKQSINIPLMQRELVPTWTTSRSDVLTQGPQSFSQNPQEESPESAEDPSCPACKNVTHQEFMDGFGRGFKALKAMSIGEITGLVSSAFQATPRGNTMGNIISSGINWGHDAQITGQVQAGQKDMQNSQNAWQGQQNQNSYKNQQQIQATDIANKRAMQNADFGHQDSMQQREFGQESRMQQAQFGQQSAMQSGLFGHENQMQSASFGQQTAMNNLDFSHNEQLSKMNIAGNIANTLTGGIVGGAFSTINTAINAGVGYLEQGRDQVFQKQMQTSNFNNQIYASGNSATALKIATPTS